MKKKILSLILATALALTLFSGCGASQEEKTEKEVVEEVEKEPEESKVESKEESVAEEPVPEVVPLVAVEIGTVGYDALDMANDQYFIVKQNDKYSLLTLDGAAVDAEQWDYYTTGMQNGSFAMGRLNADETYEYVLFDRDANPIFTNADYPSYYIESYNEDILQLSKYDEETKQYSNAYYTDYSKKQGFILNSDTVKGCKNSSAVNNGLVVISSPVRFADDRFLCFADTTGNIEAGPESWLAYPYAPTDSGYINGAIMDKETGRQVNFGVYNTKTEEMIILPDEVISTNTFKTDGIRVTATDDGHMSVQKEGTDAKAIYDIVSQQYVSDYVYSYIGFSNYGKSEHILVSIEDGEKWGYLDSDLQEVGTWYSDATDFSGGFALIQDTDGLYYVVDENFQKVSEGIEGESAHAIGGCYSGYFAIQRDGLYYTLRF